MLMNLTKKMLSSASVLAILCMSHATIVHAGPQGGTVVGGSATITQESATKTGITQTTDKAIINWQSYNINANEHVQYYQPSANSIALNRVIGQDPSKILGQLTANGNVWLINPNGILFGQGSRIDVNGLVATTHDITNSDFLAGRYNFNIPGKSGASVINEGNITIGNAGVAAFVAPSVRNSGVITARLGKVALGAANGFTLDMYGDGLISLAVSDEVAKTAYDIHGNKLDSFVKNEGKIKADGGHILLTAKAARGVVNDVVNNTGIIEARSVSQKNGVITLGGGRHGIVRNRGRIVASGRKAGQKGGKVTITGEKVALMDHAVIDVSGHGGGGTVLVGGDYQGKGDTPTSQFTYMGQDASIYADALVYGDGGKVILWADQATRAYGDIFARGGAQGGDGGFVETSGKEYLSVDNIHVDTSATAGAYGQWLLDPANIFVNSSYASTIGNSLKWNNITLAASEAVYIQSDIIKTGGRDTDFSVYAPFIYQLEGTSVISRNASLDVLYQASDRIWFGRGFDGATAKIDSNNGGIKLIAPHFIGINGTLDAGYGEVLIQANNPLPASAFDPDRGIWFIDGTRIEGLKGSGIRISSPVITGLSGVNFRRNSRPTFRVARRGDDVDDENQQEQSPIDELDRKTRNLALELGIEGLKTGSIEAIAETLGFVTTETIFGQALINSFGSVSNFHAFAKSWMGTAVAKKLLKKGGAQLAYGIVKGVMLSAIEHKLGKGPVWVLANAAFKGLDLALAQAATSGAIAVGATPLAAYAFIATELYDINKNLHESARIGIAVGEMNRGTAVSSAIVSSRAADIYKKKGRELFAQGKDGSAYLKLANQLDSEVISGLTKRRGILKTFSKRQAHEIQYLISSARLAQVYINRGDAKGASNELRKSLEHVRNLGWNDRRKVEVVWTSLFDAYQFSSQMTSLSHQAVFTQ